METLTFRLVLKFKVMSNKNVILVQRMVVLPTNAKENDLKGTPTNVTRMVY